MLLGLFLLLFFFLKINFIRVELIYSAVLISLLLFLVLLRPAPRTPHPAGLAAGCGLQAGPALLLPRAPAPCPPRSRKNLGGAGITWAAGGCSAHGHRLPVFPLLDGEQRACELCSPPVLWVPGGPWGLAAVLQEVTA